MVCMLGSVGSTVSPKPSAVTSYTLRTHIVVDTYDVLNFVIPVEARLVWPRLVLRHTVHFPLTAVGNFSVCSRLCARAQAHDHRLSI
jgi:hypothetical protein